MPNTFERPIWLQRQEALIASLSAQPILVVVRPDPADLNGADGPGSLLDHLCCLETVGLRHVEIGWGPDGQWRGFVQRVRQKCPALQLGAASVLNAEALADLEACGLPFAMSPCFDPALIERARQRGILLVPGVFSPSEIQQASAMDCGLVKLFPAATVGVYYLQRLRAPLGPLPKVIAAGGLAVADLDAWLEAGHAAVALGRRVIDVQGPDPALLRWLQTTPG